MNINNLIDEVKQIVQTHNLGSEGQYARWIWNSENNNRNLGLNEYGCADAANILYTIGDFISEPQSRAMWIKTLQEFQDPQTGLYTEDTHHFFHTTAHCVAALELFDAKPLYKLTKMLEYTKKEKLYSLLDGLDWENFPWDESHQGAGIYAALSIAEDVDEQWKKWYFDWLWDNSDPDIGFWKKDCIKKAPLFSYMGGGFHYYFNLESAKMPVRYPEKIIDSCLDMYYNNGLPSTFGKSLGFLEVDWVYCITRSSRKTTHRFDECKKALRKFATEYIEYLNSLDHNTHDGLNDLHTLFGMLCALAELQQALPGEITTKKPLRLVLDRRPFI